MQRIKVSFVGRVSEPTSTTMNAVFHAKKMTTGKTIGLARLSISNPYEPESRGSPMVHILQNIPWMMMVLGDLRRRSLSPTAETTERPSRR